MKKKRGFCRPIRCSLAVVQVANGHSDEEHRVIKLFIPRNLSSIRTTADAQEILDRLIRLPFSLDLLVKALACDFLVLRDLFVDLVAEVVEHTASKLAGMQKRKCLGGLSVWTEKKTANESAREGSELRLEKSHADVDDVIAVRSFRVTGCEVVSDWDNIFCRLGHWFRG